VLKKYGCPLNLRPKEWLLIPGKLFPESSLLWKVDIYLIYSPSEVVIILLMAIHDLVLFPTSGGNPRKSWFSIQIMNQNSPLTYTYHADSCVSDT
jgi:hypothetical protein